MLRLGWIITDTKSQHYFILADNFGYSEISSLNPERPRTGIHLSLTVNTPVKRDIEVIVKNNLEM
jgi:hypothetical protein